MIGNDIVLFSVLGQSLGFECPEGRPDSVTSIKVIRSSSGDDASGELALSASGVIDLTPNTNLSANAGAGQQKSRTIYLTSSAGVEVGRSYLIANVAGESERVEVMSVSGTKLEVRNEIINYYGAGSSFQSTRITALIDPTWVLDSSNITDDLDPNPGYRVRWEYLENGSTRVHATYFDLSRYSARHDVDANSIAARRANWINDLPVEHRVDRGQGLINAAYTEVAFDLFNANLPAEMLRNRAVVNELTMLKSIQILSEDKATEPGANTVAYEIDSLNYQRRLDSLIQTTGKVQIATDTSGAGNGKQDARVWRR